MGKNDDWQPRRPPPSTSELRKIEAAKKANQRERERQHDERIAEEKRQREDVRKQLEARDLRLKQMQPELEKRRTECRLRVLEMLPEIRQLRLAWDDIVNSMTKGYSNAYKTFTDTIELEKKHDEQMAAIAFSVLSMVSVGGLSMLSTIAQNKWIASNTSQIFVNGIEDGLQQGADKLMSGLAAIVPETVMQDIPLPINFKGDLQTQLNKYESAMNGWVKAKGDMYRTLDLSWFDVITPKDLEEEIDRFWSELHAKFAPVPIEVSAFEREIEMGLWAYWLGHKIRVGGRWGVVKLIAGKYRGIGLPILRRLQQLSLISEQEVQAIHFEADRWSQNTFERLERWGANWRPSRVFGAPKGQS